MTTATGKLKLTTKLAYGSGDLGAAIATAINGFYLLNFLLNVAGLQPLLVGFIYLVAKIVDAVADPVVGYLTDHTVSRFGRRRPWLLFAAVPFGLAFILQWLVPPLGDIGKFVYYLVVALLLDAAFNSVNMPYAAMTAELTPDYNERTSLSSIRMSFSIIGGVLAAFFNGQIINLFPPGDSRGYTIGAFIWALFIIVPCFIVFFGTAGVAPVAAAKPASKGPGFFEGMGIAFRNRAFVLVTLVYLFSWLAIQFVQTNLQLYTKDWIGINVSLFSFLLLTIQTSSFIWVLIWAKVSERIGKKNIYYLGAAFFVAALLSMFFLRPGQTTLIFVIGAIAGIGISVAYLVPWSMIPDVVEMDELETGQRREGVFYGFFVFVQKLGLAVGLAISSWVLQWAGYVTASALNPNPVQPASALLALRALIGPAAAVVLLGSFVAVYLYPITREKHDQMRAELDRRAKEKSALS
jgi:GPH family glycoside/pentoside/hexuronide:cation symporter